MQSTIDNDVLHFLIPVSLGTGMGIILSSLYRIYRYWPRYSQHRNLQGNCCPSDSCTSYNSKGSYSMDNTDSVVMQSRKKQSSVRQKLTLSDGADLAIREGFTMQEAREFCAGACSKSHSQTPMDVVKSLQRGNTRFWMGVAIRPELSAFERRALMYVFI